MIEHRYPEFHPVAPLPVGKDLVAALDFRRLPKVLLHEHLDGGLRPATIVALAKEQGYRELPTSDPAELAAWFHRGAQRGNLPEYLEGFAHTIAVMQTRDALARVACEFLEDMAADGVVYAEVRFAPVFHTSGGLTQDEVVESVLAGLEEGGKKSGVEWGLIICAMRDRTDSLEAADLAIRWRDRGVVGFDLAGGEYGHPPKKHVDAFQAIERANFYITIHAGEAFGPDSIWQALQWCGAHRLGHGTRLRNDIEVLPDGSLKLGHLAQYILDRRVPLEMCLSSNVHTGACVSFEEHPFAMFQRAGFRVFLNTDDRLMSDTEMSKELAIAASTFGLSLVELEKMTMDAMKKRLLPAPETSRADPAAAAALLCHAVRRTHRQIFRQATSQESSSIMIIPERILMGPGPSTVPSRILRAMSSPTLGHLDPRYIEIMDSTCVKLRKVFETENALTFPVSATGMAGMECVVTNLLEPGDEAIVCVNGVFGARMVDVMERAGVTVHRLEVPWGEIFPLEMLAEAIDRHPDAKALGIVHAETSTGALQPLEGLGELLREVGMLFIVDAVTSLAGHPLKVDEWGIDAIYSGTQKCLSCPPGLSPVSFSPRAVEVTERRATKTRSWYFDITMLKDYYKGSGKRAYHHTAPVNMIYALHEALTIVLEEGLEARHARHARLHRRLRAGLESMGISYIPVHSLHTLNCVHIPEGADDAAVRAKLLEDYSIEIGAGLGPFAGKAWRIGLMGHSATQANVDLVLAALVDCLE